MGLMFQRGANFGRGGGADGEAAAMQMRAEGNEDDA